MSESGQVGGPGGPPADESTAHDPSIALQQAAADAGEGPPESGAGRDSRDGSLEADNIEPVRAVMGIVATDGTHGPAVQALADEGIADQRIRVLRGDADAELLQPGGTGIMAVLGALLSDVTEFRDEAIAALHEGRCVVVVTDVEDDDGSHLMDVMQDAGLVNVRHFGKWAAE